MTDAEDDARETRATEQVVTPWDVEGKDGGGIDYDKLVRDFGCSTIDRGMIERVERVTGVKGASVPATRDVLRASRAGFDPGRVREG